jgi:hypothetical protein
MVNALAVLCLNVFLALAGSTLLADSAEAMAYCESDDTQPACSMADAIAQVAEAEVSPFAGPESAKGAVVALAVVAWHESRRLDPTIIDCSGCPLGGPRCDRGRSVSAFQLFQGVAWKGYAREDICQDSALAASLALHWLTYHGRRTKSLGGMYRGYAAGDPAKKSDAAVRMERMFLWAAAKTKLGTVTFASKNILP